MPVLIMSLWFVLSFLQLNAKSFSVQKKEQGDYQPETLNKTQARSVLKRPCPRDDHDCLELKRLALNSFTTKSYVKGPDAWRAENPDIEILDISNDDPRRFRGYQAYRFHKKSNPRGSFVTVTVYPNEINQVGFRNYMGYYLGSLYVKPSNPRKAGPYTYEFQPYVGPRPDSAKPIM